MMDFQKSCKNDQNKLPLFKIQSILGRMYESATTNPDDSQRIIRLYIYFEKVRGKLNIMNQVIDSELITKISDYLNENEIVKSYKTYKNIYE